MSTPLSPSQTLETASKGFSSGLSNKLLEMTGHGLIKSDFFARIPTAQLDEFVKADGPDLRQAYIQLVERRFEAFTKCYQVPVDYAAPNAVQAAIEENRFAKTYIYVEVSDIPLCGEGEAVEMVREVHFDKVMYNRDLPEALKQRGIEAGFANGYKFANPLTALKFAKKNPDKQKEYPFGILFYIGKQLCCLCLGAGGEGRRVRVDKGYPDGYWLEAVRFLVVPA